MPENTIKVDRSTKWGNPFVAVDVGGLGLAARDAADAVYQYRLRIVGLIAIGAKDFTPLHGKNLACWCRLCEQHRDGKPLGVECSECEPCHADVLLELANEGETE